MVPEFGGLELRRIEHFPGDLIPGNYGILEPDPLRTPFESGFDLDLILVPDMAFTEHGYRLGYGGGYYDRFLEAEPDHPLVALCYDFQMLDEIPVEPHDVKMDKVISEFLNS